MKAKAIRAFYDIQNGTLREEGAVFECDRERYDEINARIPGYVEEAEAEPKPEPEPEQAEEPQPDAEAEPKPKRGRKPKAAE